MKSIKFHITFALLAVTLLTSCHAPKKVPYLVDAENIPVEILSQQPASKDPVITIGDLLNIEVTGSNITAVTPFNKGRVIDTEGRISSVSKQLSNVSDAGLEVSTDYYLVDANGNIEFPIVGQIHVLGLTKTELAQKIVNEIYPKYLTEKPGVDIRLMNFRVTVAGAVKNPGVYSSKNERMTFLEALSRAGDMDIKGERETVLLYRTNPDGTREVHRVNLHDRDFLLSPYMNLQQNDYIYVVPNSSMRKSAWQLDPAVSASLTIFGSVTSIASLVIGILNLTKD